MFMFYSFTFLFHMVFKVLHAVIISSDCERCNSDCLEKENHPILIDFSCTQCKSQVQQKTCKLYLPHLPQFLLPGNPLPMQMVQFKVTDCSALRCPRGRNRQARERAPRCHLVDGSRARETGDVRAAHGQPSVRHFIRWPVGFKVPVTGNAKQFNLILVVRKALG